MPFTSGRDLHGRPRFTTRNAEGLPRLGQTGLTAEAFAEVPDEIDPRLGTAVQTLKNRSTLGRNHADFVFPNLTTCPVEQLQILIQSHRQAAFVAGSPECDLLSHVLSWRIQSHRSQPTGPLTMLDPYILSLRGRNRSRRRSICNPLLHAREVAGLGSCCNASSNRIQIDIRHAGGHRRFIEQNLCTKSTFPEAAPVTPRNSVWDEAGKSG